MKIEHARAIGNALLAAATTAENKGETEVSALIELRALDDAARAELDAAIKASETQPAGLLAGPAAAA